MVTLSGGIKGGDGKSEMAKELVIIRSQRHSDKDVLFVDADDQEPAYDFTILRNEKLGNAGYTCVKITGQAVRTEILKLKEKYDDVIIDAGGRDNVSLRAAIAVADIIVTPFSPKSFDIWSLEKLVRVIEEMRPANPELKAFSYLNMAFPERKGAKTSDNDEAADILKENQTIQFLNNVRIVNRKAFSNASGQGLGVTELTEKAKDPKAMMEISNLYNAVFHSNHQQ